MLDQRLAHVPLVGKLVRYSAASVAGVVTSQATLLFCFTVVGLSAAMSNVIAVTLGAVPNYLINRAWTWKKNDRHSVSREVVPFWAMAFLGLLLSTVAVDWAADRFDDNPLAVSGANIAAFGVLWVAKFVVLDRVLFRLPS